MKEIKAYIRPVKLTDVVEAIKDMPSVTGISISKVDGFGSEAKRDILGSSQPYNKLEIVCDDDTVNTLVAVIKEKAFTGRIGDGKIFIYNVESVVVIVEE